MKDYLRKFKKTMYISCAVETLIVVAATFLFKFKVIRPTIWLIIIVCTGLLMGIVIKIASKALKREIEEDDDPWD